MSSVPPPGPGPSSVGRRIDEAIELIEMEVRHAAAYVNAAVIPQVRTESISALRTGRFPAPVCRPPRTEAARPPQGPG